VCVCVYKGGETVGPGGAGRAGSDEWIVLLACPHYVHGHWLVAWITSPPVRQPASKDARRFDRNRKVQSQIIMQMGLLISWLLYYFLYILATHHLLHVFLFFEKKTIYGLSLMGSGEGACFGA
jgi:hypothetical protein